MSGASADRIWYGKGPGARLARWGLTPLSWLYAAGWSAYAASYRLGLKKARHPHSPIVCVGNLVVGGSGKTPLTLHIADVLREMGREVVVGCSGYGGPASVGATLAPDGPLNAAEWGDEPAMMRRLRPDLALIVGRDRVAAAQNCHDTHPEAVLLMDDGLQHLPLKKDVVVLVESGLPNGLCLPAGPYREPKGRQAEADIVVPRDFQAVVAGLRFEDAEQREVRLDGPVNVLCAIGDPARFVEDLRKAGICVETVKALRDHDKLDAGNLWDGLAQNRPVVVTAKDWVKLALRPDTGLRQVVVAVQSVELEPRDEFRTRLASHLHEVA